MKKIISLFFLLLLLFNLSSVAFAETSCLLPELNLMVSIPDGWIVFTKDINENDPNLAKLNTDKATLESQMTYSSNYVYAYNLDEKTDITISSWVESAEADKTIFDLKKFDDLMKSHGSKSPKLRSDSIIKDLQAGDITLPSGITGETYGKYEHPQAAFLQVSGTAYANSTDVSALEFYTVVNGNNISIQLRNYAGKVTAEQEVMLKKVVDSVKFSQTASLPDDVVKAYEKKIYSKFLYFSFDGLLASLAMTALLYLLVTGLLRLFKLYFSNDASVIFVFVDGVIMMLGLRILGTFIDVKIGLTLWYILVWIAAAVGFLKLNFKRNGKAYDEAYQKAMDNYNKQKQEEELVTQK